MHVEFRAFMFFSLHLFVFHFASLLPPLPLVPSLIRIRRKLVEEVELGVDVVALLLDDA